MVATITDMMTRPRFTSASGRTVGFLDFPGMERLAEEHEWMRDRIAHLELENALLRSVVEATGAVPCRAGSARS